MARDWMTAKKFWKPGRVNPPWPLLQRKRQQLQIARSCRDTLLIRALPPCLAAVTGAGGRGPSLQH